MKDYGDLENQDMLEKFKISKENLPVIQLYFPVSMAPVSPVHQLFFLFET